MTQVRKSPRKRRLFPIIAFGLGLCSTTASNPVAAQRPVVLAVVDVKVVELGYRVTELVGRPVTNPAGEKVGRIDDFVIQRDKVLMTIIRVGGFLGMGGRKIAIPYSNLIVSPAHIILPGASQQTVAKLPTFNYR